MEQFDFYKIFSTALPIEPNVANEIYFQHLSMEGLEEMHKYSISEKLYEFFEFGPFKHSLKLQNTLKSCCSGCRARMEIDRHHIGLFAE